MRTLRQWLDLPRADKRLLLAAGWWVVTYRVALWTLPVRVILRMARHNARMRELHADTDEIIRVNRAVGRAARCMPGATCLTRSLTAYTLLGRRGIVTQLRIGVKKGEAGQLLAHAWLERDGVLLVSTEDPGNYRSFPPIDLLAQLTEHQASNSSLDAKSGLAAAQSLQENRAE